MIICADDFGLSSDINAAIIELASLGKIQAASCMTMLPQCNSSALKPLLKYAPPLLVGLHLVLTDENPVTPAAQIKTLAPNGRLPSFNSLIIKNYLRKIVLSQIEAEINAQYKMFLEKTGRNPDFIDGHLFAHQLPIIREALIKFVKKIPSTNRPFVRSSNMHLKRILQRKTSILKNLIISYPGRALHQRLTQEKIPTNKDFAGIYNYKYYAKFPKYFLRFVKYTDKDGGVIMVHPGSQEAFRRIEYQTLLKS